MLSKNKIKFIRSLQQKKFRNEFNAFLVEGVKGIEELLKSDWNVQELFLTAELSERLGNQLNNHTFSIEKTADIEKASGLKNNRDGIAIVEQKKEQTVDWDNGFILYLDGISDPGNLGTIIRTAEWFGVKQVICSEESVDFYNSKVIQSTMGSFARLIPRYISFQELTAQLPDGYPVYATFLDGESPSEMSKQSKGLLVMGSESHGVSENFLKLNPIKITIPSGSNSPTESLNVAIATSILCYEINRK